MRKWNTIIVMTLMSCGQQPSGVKTEYFVEQSEDDHRDREDTEGPTNKSDDANPGVNDPKLTLSFKDPIGADSNGIIKIEVEIENAYVNSTWSAWFSAKEDLSSPTIIEDDLTIATTSVDWDVSALGAGTFYLFAEVKVEGKTKTFKAPNPVVLESTGNPTNTKPSISLDFPLGDNVFVSGTPQNIRWKASDLDNDVITYRVDYSANGGINWTMVADNITEKTYAWDVTGLTQGITYKVKVTAKDAKGATNFALSTKNFGVATSPMTFAGGFGTMLAQRCGSCHAAGQSNQAQFRSDVFSVGTIGVTNKMARIKLRIENNTMPTAGGLGDPDKAILTMWLWGGGQ